MSSRYVFFCPRMNYLFYNLGKCIDIYFQYWSKPYVPHFIDFHEDALLGQNGYGDACDFF